MVSTHTQRPYRPAARDLRIMELYADFAGEAVTRHLGPSARQDPVDPACRAMISALLDPARGREENVSVPFELWVMGRMTASFARRAPTPERPAAGARLMMHVRFSQIIADPRVLAGCISYIRWLQTCGSCCRWCALCPSSIAPTTSSCRSPRGPITVSVRSFRRAAAGW